MKTGNQRYKNHPVWETLQIKLDALRAARFDDEQSEQLRSDIVEWLDYATTFRTAKQPSLYIDVLDEFQKQLNGLPTTTVEFKSYCGITPNRPSQPGHYSLAEIIRKLPPAMPKNFAQPIVDLLDREVDMRSHDLARTQDEINKLVKILDNRSSELEILASRAAEIELQLDMTRNAVKDISESAGEKSATEWNTIMAKLQNDAVLQLDARNREALENVSLLAAIARAGETLAKHAAGDISATEWYARATRERRAAQYMRALAVLVFGVAIWVGWALLSQTIEIHASWSIGESVLKASLAILLGGFGALVARESRRHFRESDAAEDVAMSLTALAPFYAGAGDDVNLNARVRLGDAVFVKNLLSRFAQRDAIRNAGEINTADLPALINDAKLLLKPDASSTEPKI